MYLENFGLQEKPFHITPNPRFIFLSKNHKEAFAHLLYGVQQRVGFLSLTGEVGTGKTTVLRTLLSQLEESSYQVALIFNPCLTSLELLQAIHREFSIPCSAHEANLSRLHDSLNRFLLEQRQKGKTVVLVVDEAQNLEPAVLEQLRLLSNLETESDKLLQLIIVGQPELEQVLERHELRQLKQRITVRYHLRNMDSEDTAAYIRHRLKVAGFSGAELFTLSGLDRVYRLTAGLPRLINILCDRALLVAYTQDRRKIDKVLVDSAQRELSGSDKKKQGRKLRLAVMGSLLFFLLVFVLFQQGHIAEFIAALSVSSPPVAQKTSEEKVARASAEVAAIDETLLAELKQAVFDLTEAGSGRNAASEVVKQWGGSGVSEFQPNQFRPMEAALRTSGFSSIRFQGSIDRLLEFDSPAILSVVLPNLRGKRYLALLAYREGRVLTFPRLTVDGWLPLTYLDHLWFGSAVIPWKNFERLPYLDTPGKAGSGVRRTQELMTLAGYPQLKVSGIYDQATIAAVSDLQQKMGLAPDGRIGAQTLLQLYRLIGLDMPQLRTESAL